MALRTDIPSIKQRFGIYGQSPLLHAALDTAVRASPTNLAILITGESGVGKESFSKIIHQLSPRRHEPFIAVNCGAIPDGTINSELFGHEKGSYTGSIGERKGYFEAVDGGTIFLDEIGEMPLDTQAFLLRILENGEFLRLGSSKVLKTNVRVVAATNVNLEERVRKGKFREDLYYRLNQVPIRVPSLKDRREDIWPLFRLISQDFKDRNKVPTRTLTVEARQLLENYAWPGNIRELKNSVEHLSIMTDMDEVTATELLRILPNLGKRNLPSLNNHGDTGHADYTERDILYKLLFDMKNDLNDLKALVFDLISGNNLRVNNTNMSQIQQLVASASNVNLHNAEPSVIYTGQANPMASYSSSTEHNVNRAVFLDNNDASNHEVVDENMSIDEMEKNMISRALKKHNSRRKEAAADLGLSERTLYRKIRQYGLD
jgi:DNA-binding NtrC family response regulator